MTQTSREPDSTMPELPPSPSRPRARDLGLAAVWLALDQATKFWAASSLRAPLVIVPEFFQLTLSHNTGALFGAMSDWPAPYRLVLLTVLPCVAIVFIVAMLVQTPIAERWTRIGLALILGGATGNVLDRVVRGYVIDFLDVYWGLEPVAGFLRQTLGGNHWPTFNVADTGLTVGASLLLFQILRRRAAERPTRVSASD